MAPPWVARVCGAVALLASPGVASAEPDVISCGGGYSDICFDCVGSAENNTCGSYPQASCAQPGGGDVDHLLSFRSARRTWVEATFDWGSNIRGDLFVQRGSYCGNTVACSNALPQGALHTTVFTAEANTTYYLAFEQTHADSWGVHYGLDVAPLVCCYDADGDGGFNAANCPSIPLSLQDCNDSDPSNSRNLPEVCDGRDNNCDGTADEGLPFTTYYRDADGDGYGNAATAISACAAPANYVTDGTDCDDSTGQRHPGLTETCDGLDNNCNNVVDENVQTRYWRDFDGDAFGDPNTSTLACAQPAGFASNRTDCDDRDANRKPGLAEWCDGKDNDCNTLVDDGVGTIWYRDFDRDGQGNPALTVQSCDAVSGYVSNAADCDDHDVQRSPALSEWCDGKDNDCNTLVDDGVGTLWYPDVDGDLHGDETAGAPFCQDPAGSFVTLGDDCDDADGERYAGLAEWCDGKDNDCNTQVDDGVGAVWFRDFDGDLYGDDQSQRQACELPAGFAVRGGDCDDADRQRNPGFAEICDSKDNNCDTLVDNNATDASLWYRDLDRDTWGGSAETTRTCLRPDPSWSYRTGDCDDSERAVHPTAAEVPYDGVDQDCVAGDWCDVDGDGFAASLAGCGGADCADDDASVAPGVVEVLDGVDNNCDGLVDEGTTAWDDDGDGWTEDAGDCDDANENTNPGAREVCSGDDTDCDGIVDENTSCSDDDHDGWTEDAGDCDDTDPTINPGVTEVLGDGRDNDCDGVADGGFDTDHDGVTVAAGDCDDTDNTVRPGLPELPDGKDNNCNGVVDEGTDLSDDDGDGLSEADGDCDDTDPAVFPGATEVDNGRDDDCNGVTDDGGLSWDDDGDGLSEADGDCDDSDIAIHPGATEVANGEDDDCDGQIDEGLDDFDDDGFAVADGDCDDENGWVNPGATEVCDLLDNDCNNQVDEGCDGLDTGSIATARCSCATTPTPLAWTGLIVLMLGVTRRRQ